VIARFVDALRALVALPPRALAEEPGRRLVADCADALRLELDCPQQEFTRVQRAALHRLADALDDAQAAPARVQRAVREACGALGVAPAEVAGPERGATAVE
jgi:hypothetical protein